MKRFFAVLVILGFLFGPTIVRASECENFNVYTGQCEDSGLSKAFKRGAIPAVVVALVVLCYYTKGKLAPSREDSWREEQKSRDEYDAKHRAPEEDPREAGWREQQKSRGSE